MQSYKFSSKEKLPTSTQVKMIKKPSKAQLAAKPNKQERYPFYALEVGQNFYVPNKSPRSLSASLWRASQKYGRTYLLRATPKGTRVFRVA
jgi:hypothetical protein